MKTYTKFAVLIAIIIGTLAWLAAGSINDTKSYYKTIAEMSAMGDKAFDKRIRVTGNVAENSIVRNGKGVQFTLVEEKRTLKVVYNGAEPLPDTFRDGAQALADGKLGRDGVFHANKIAAKCASKYEGKPGQNLKDKPVYDSKAGL
jgi:cytochrome c-type biogenesis protein CcmE